MEQNKESRNGSSTLWSTYLGQSRKDYPMEKNSLSNQWCWENWIAACKNETGSFPYTIHKSRLKMDERPQCETGIHQNPQGEHKQ